MSNFTREAAPTALADIRTMLVDVAFPLPEDVTRAIAAYERVTDMRPVETTAQTLREAYLAGADPDELERHAARAAADHLNRGAWKEARIDLAVAAVATIRDHGAEVIEHVRDDAERIIDDITWWATSGMPTADRLLRANKVADAKRAAGINGAFIQFQSLRKLRTAVTPRQFPWVRLAFTAPVDVTKVKPGDLGDVARAIANDCELWWPSWSQAVKAQAELERADEQEAAAAAANARLIHHSAV